LLILRFLNWGEAETLLFAPELKENRIMTNQYRRFAGRVCAVSALSVALAAVSPAQTIIHTFTDINNAGGMPWAAPVEGFDTNLYGTASIGGQYNRGIVYKLGPTGKLIWQYNFCKLAGCPDGSDPMAALEQAPGGLLFGLTKSGGSNLVGESFAISSTGTLTRLSSFGDGSVDGAQPDSPMVAAIDGWEWGTAMFGGNNGNYGVIFQQELANNGRRSIMYNFCNKPGCTDGYFPEGPLVQASDGKIYGTTNSGGLWGGGTLFRWDPASLTLSTLHHFCALPSCADGTYPMSGVIQGKDGNFYGVASSSGVTPSGPGKGTIFKISPAGSTTVLHTFSGPDGATPVGIVQSSNGIIYGMTEGGGNHNLGTLFKITTGGVFTKLHDFTGGDFDGSLPHSAPMQRTDGNIYGTTRSGGSVLDTGVVFRLNTGLKPFVKLLPALGQVGSVVAIYGTQLAGTTAVTFNGVPSTAVTQASPTLVYAKVPAGATTGPIKVTTASGSLIGNVGFKVLP
jgi:uncharacterized repeat protein (TIGR03803 family)